MRKNFVCNLLLVVLCAFLSSCGTKTETYKGHVINLLEGTVTDAAINVRGGKIVAITPCEVADSAPFYLPGFVDAHVHIESSMMLPETFADIAKRHGSVGAVCDPHEIANVLGIKGVELMLDNAKQTNFCFAFGVPSCVPSCGTDIETSGAVLDSKAVAALLQRDDIYALAEMMNYPGVLGGDEEVMAKIAAAQAVGKPVDGHAPGVRGEDRLRYAQAGITTDHECSQLDEARDAIACGMKILIREGSAAKNYAALSPLIAESPSMLMFCTDDSHPTDLVNGHINRIVRRAIADGYSVMDILRIACLNPVQHYRLPLGLLQVGDNADFIAISDTTSDFRVLATYLDGVCQKEADCSSFTTEEWMVCCVAAPITTADIARDKEGGMLHQIVATDGSLLTDHYIGKADEHTQKLVVYNRYVEGAQPRVAYIRGFEMQHGAIAQTIAHDCHNIIAIGTNDSLLVEVINRVIAMRGGIVVTDGTDMAELPLPIAGILSSLPGDELAQRNEQLEQMVCQTGCPLNSPFITLGFMALPVIPQLKLTDKGLFDASVWQMIE